MLLLFSWSGLESFLDPGVPGAGRTDSPPWVLGCGRVCVCVCVCVQARQGPGSRCGWLKWAAKQPGAPSWALWEPRAAVTRGSGLAALQIPPSGGSASCVCAWRLEPGRRGAGPVPSGTRQGVCEGGPAPWSAPLPQRSSVAHGILASVHQTPPKCLP